jgi:hypothetical protein
VRRHRDGRRLHREPSIEAGRQEYRRRLAQRSRICLTGISINSTSRIGAMGATGTSRSSDEFALAIGRDSGATKPVRYSFAIVKRPPHSNKSRRLTPKRTPDREVITALRGSPFRVPLRLP